jgi:hypothetical protein
MVVIRRARGLALCLITSLIVAGCTPDPEATSGDPEPQTGAAEVCGAADYLLLFARGSGQPDDVEDQVETQRFFEAIDAVIDSDRALEKVGLGYEAAGGTSVLVEAFWSGGDSGRYYESRQGGTEETVRFLEARAAACTAAGSHQRFIIGGYSQGAHVVREATFEISDDVMGRIQAIMLFGDPTFDDSPIARGGTQGFQDGILGGESPQVPEGLEPVSQSWCDSQDIICAGPTGVIAALMDLLHLSDDAHEGYPQSEMELAARELLAQSTPDDVIPRVEVPANEFVDHWKGRRSCPESDTLVLDLDVKNTGAEADGRQPVGATLDIYDADGDTFLARSSLSGTASDGTIDLRHFDWHTEDPGMPSIDVAATAEVNDGGDEPIARMVSSGGADGCTFVLTQPRED